MTSGSYRVFAGETPGQQLTVLRHGSSVHTACDMWVGHGVVIDRVYCGEFQDRIGGGRGTHRATPAGDGVYDVVAEFDGGLVCPLQWRPES